MMIRPVLIALASAAAALAPVGAHARDGVRDGASGELAAKLGDPAAQMAAAAAMAAIAETILDMDISPITRVLGAAGGGEVARDLPPDARMRDLAGPRADDMPREIARNVPRAMGSMGRMAGALDEMMPQLRDAARRMKEALPEY